VGKTLPLLAGYSIGEAVFNSRHPCDMGQMLQVLVEAERCAIRTYTEICKMTFGKDHRMYEVALAILHEEVEHEAWFSEYLRPFPPWRAGSVAPRPAVYDREHRLSAQRRRGAMRSPESLTPRRAGLPLCVQSVERRVKEARRRRAQVASCQCHAGSRNSRESHCRRPAAK
jgi:hypothetical protein